MRIGTVELKGRVVLAPMAGVTDFAFRELCRRCGAAFTTTEMVSARALTYGDLKSRELLWLSEEETPAAVQIFMASDPGRPGNGPNPESPGKYRPPVRGLSGGRK